MKLRLPVELAFTDSRDVTTARSVNVSETGILVSAEVHRPPGTKVRFHVAPRYDGLGEIAWTREESDGRALMGLAFPRSRYALIELLDEHVR